MGGWEGVRDSGDITTSPKPAKKKCCNPPGGCVAGSWSRKSQGGLDVASCHPSKAGQADGRTASRPRPACVRVGRWGVMSRWGAHQHAPMPSCWRNWTWPAVMLEELVLGGGHRALGTSPRVGGRAGQQGDDCMGNAW